MAQARAAQGRKVLLVDMDKQASAVAWHNQRAKLAPNAMKIHLQQQLGEGAGKRIEAFIPDYDDVVIDTRGAEAKNREMRHAMLLADRMVTPVQTGLFDTLTLLEMAEIVSEAQAINAKLRAHILITCVSPYNHRADEIREELADLPGYSGFLKTQVYRRAVYELVAEMGQSVSEFARNARQKAARDEMEALASEVWA
jgi:cellulose biosynthesis protein BcsQ